MYSHSPGGRVSVPIPGGGDVLEECGGERHKTVLGEQGATAGGGRELSRFADVGQHRARARRE